MVSITTYIILTAALLAILAGAIIYVARPVKNLI